MHVIQAITKTWIDMINLNESDAIRVTNNDNGTYNFEENNEILKINWKKWGTEIFHKVNDYYVNLDSSIFEIELDNNEWNDIGIFDLNNNQIYRKYYPSENGKFTLKDNILSIEWKNWGKETFYQLNYGKTYTNTKFGNLLQNNASNASDASDASNFKNINKEIKILAIVFPQFHEIPENNQFWGEGFTEWTLLKNIPRIVNGEIIKQPHSDIGYFNLKDYNHRKYMRQLADKYNIHGFCFYHYWFKDKKVMYEPTELMLLDGEPDKPFLFCWANEKWTKRWDGGNNEILLEQTYDDIDGNNKHFYYLLDFFKHKNYIKKHNKPIFIFYRIEKNEIEAIREIIKLWNSLAIKEGFNGIHFMRFLGPFNNDINMEEINGFVEFQPGYATQQRFNDIITEDKNKIFENDEYNEEIYLLKNNDIKDLVEKKILNNGYEHYKITDVKERGFRTSKFFVYDGQKLYDSILALPKINNEQHRGISVNWNNTPRRNYQSIEYSKYPHYYEGISPNLFGTYFYKLLEKISLTKNEGNNYLFISAWNEWNEQAVLEPNNEDGYDYLNTINAKYLEFYNNPIKKRVLNFCHKGGGTEKYMNDLKRIFKEYEFIDFVREEKDNKMNYKNVDIIHINSIILNDLKHDYHIFFKNHFRNIRKILTIHDYQWLFENNPNILKEDFEKESKKLLTDKILELFDVVDTIIFPSKNIHDNYARCIDLNKYADKINIVYHSDKIINHNFLVIPSLDTNKEINIAFIGEYVKYKGSQLFEEIIKRKDNYKDFLIRYHVYGTVHNDSAYNDKIIYHSRYHDNSIIDELHENKIHGILHLSVFEESYCYALTNSINSGIPIFYLMRGSFNERLEENTFGRYHGVETEGGIDIDKICDKFNDFLDYIIENNNISIFHKLNQNIQPNKWYIENY